MANIPFLNNAYFSAKVGIGTDSPDADFVVSHQGTSGIEIEANFQMGVNNILSFDRTAGALAYETMRLSANDFWFTVLGVERMRIDSVGNVGIGTDSPTSTLTVSSSVGADGSWNKSGILIENTSTITGEPTLAFRNAGTAGTGANYWHTGLNQSNVYKIAYGTSFTDGNTKFELSTNGALRLNSYTQGFLQTDANGNVGLTGGGTLPGGPYLPLSAGSTKPLTGDLYIPGFIYHVSDTNTYFGFGAPDVFDLVVGGSRKLYADGTALYLYHNGSQKLRTTSTGVTVTGDIKIDSALLSNQENTDVDTGAEVVAQVAIATYTAAFFDFVIKKTTNVRSGTVYACHDGTNVEFTETSTNDLGDTSDVTLSVDISGTNMRLLATVTSDDWSVKSLIRAI